MIRAGWIERGRAMADRSSLARRELLQTAAIAGGNMLANHAPARSAAPPEGKAALPRVQPHDIGIDPKRLRVAYDLMEKWTAGPKAPVPGGAILVGRSGKAVAPRF